MTENEIVAYEKRLWKRYLRKKSVAERYGVGERALEKWVAAGKLPPPFYLPNSRFPLWDEDELDAFDRQSTRVRPRVQQATAQP